MVKLRLKDSNWMSRLPNILSLFRIVGGITLLLCDVVGTTFQEKTKKLLTRPLGHDLTLQPLKH
jgi:hypothetical protein